MRFLKTLGAAAALFAVAAVVIFAVPQSGETANWTPDHPSDANNDHASGYVAGGASMTLDNLPEPDGDCVGSRKYKVEVRRRWGGNNTTTHEAANTRIVNVGDSEWPESITIDNLDTGGKYRFKVNAICSLENDERDSSGFQTFNRLDSPTTPDYDHTGDWVYAYGDADEVEFHVQPSSACGYGYGFAYRINSTYPWTHTIHQRSAAQETSEEHQGFIVFTIDNANPFLYDAFHGYCLYGPAGGGNSAWMNGGNVRY